MEAAAVGFESGACRMRDELSNHVLTTWYSANLAVIKIDLNVWVWILNRLYFYIDDIVYMSRDENNRLDRCGGIFT